MFIVFDGIDGAGKTTHIKFFSEWLNEKKIDFIKVREPGGEFISEKIRKIFLENSMDPLSQLMLISAARLENTKIWKNEKRLILCDRFIDSTYAYQGVSLDHEIIDYFIEKTALIKPDLVFLFLNIKKKKEKNKMDEYFEKNYKHIIENFKKRALGKENYIIIPDDSIKNQQSLIQKYFMQYFKV